MKMIVLLILAVLLPAVPGIQAAEVKNLMNGQRGSQAFARFDLVGMAGEKEAEVIVFIEVGDERYPADKLSLKGAFGPKVTVGAGKEIVWDVPADLPGGYEGDIFWDVEASGGGRVSKALAGGGFSDPATGMHFVGVKGGCYQMGNSFGDGGEDEKPVHEVCVSDFAIAACEVTQEQWKKVMGSNPSRFKMCGPDCPVENVSWNDAREFISKLNSRSGRNYRLPTEAEWEYAARSGGRSEKFSGGNDIEAVTWYESNSGRTTHRVGTKQPNGLEIYDMSGNVWEWVSDWYGADPNSKLRNPQGPPSGFYRVARGGSWRNGPKHARTSFPYDFSPDDRSDNLGFRLVSPAVR